MSARDDRAPEQRTLDVGADIRTASTPPGWLYTDADVFERTRDRVFAASWQLVGDGRELRESSCVKPVTLLEGCLDEPLVLTRDASGTLRCLSNVCTHRGNLVQCEAARKSVLTCAYHGRKFDLDGKLKSAPEFEGAAGFPSARDDLPRVALESMHGFLFASLRPSHAFEALTGDLVRRMSWFPFDDLAFDASRSREYTVRANWALYCDNYLEGFHIPYVHAALNAAIDWSAYSIELFPHSSVQIALARDGEAAFEPRDGANAREKRVAAYYWWLWPNSMLNFYPWGLSINVVRPAGVDETRVSFITYVCDAAKLERGAGSGLDRVEREDEAAVEAVQRGVRSRLYDRGRYSPAREQGVHHFHRMLAQALS
jgi:choline monooxygenase